MREHKTEAFFSAGRAGSREVLTTVRKTHTIR
jgi:hypothetical protein